MHICIWFRNQVVIKSGKNLTMRTRNARFISRCLPVCTLYIRYEFLVLLLFLWARENFLLLVSWTQLIFNSYSHRCASTSSNVLINSIRLRSLASQIYILIFFAKHSARETRRRTRRRARSRWSSRVMRLPRENCKLTATLPD